MQCIYLSLGSNLGNREELLHKAVLLIGERLGKVDEQSSYYLTQAWGKTDQPDFINQVVTLHSDKQAPVILAQVLEIERLLGRMRIEKWGERTMDIDILFYGDQIINEPNLIIPHPLLHKRRFIIEPMLEIASDFIHPVLGKTIKTIEMELSDNLFVQRI